MATYKSIQLARRRGYGTIHNMDLHIEFYNGSGKGKGANRKEYQRIKARVRDKFFAAFEQFRRNVEAGEWAVRVSYDFGDE